MGAQGGPSAAGPSSRPGTAAPAQPPTTCSSCFRVINLDHESGEPYRRSRWTCMEYYEQDWDSSVLTRPGTALGTAIFSTRPLNGTAAWAPPEGGWVVVASMQGAPGSD
ncbi:TSC22 domain family protein 2 [Sciurus carolinensis]|uniref:TSC22 domain family protein 2 n=1 Tax=Sciurus carolinensis TaxID=30640 RepID=A0AA41NBF4_SCICA|nr:TSC22 domain family protein 2 [Sciurus carolinensis]